MLKLAVSYVSIGLAASLLLSSCGGSNERTDTEWWELEGDRVALEAKVELHQMRLDKLLAKVSKAEALKAKFEDAQRKSDELLAQISRLEVETNTRESEIAELRSKSMMARREASVGRKLDRLIGLTGREYRDVTITSVTDAGLFIKHSSGIARLVATDLSAPQRIEFGVDSTTSRAAIDLELAKASTYNRMVDQHELKEREKRIVAAERATENEESRRVAQRRTASHSGLQESSSNPLHQPPRSVRGSNRYSSSGYRTYYTSRRYFESPRSYGCSPLYGVPGRPSSNTSRQSSLFSTRGPSRGGSGSSTFRPSTPTTPLPRPCPSE